MAPKALSGRAIKPDFEEPRARHRGGYTSYELRTGIRPSTLLTGIFCLVALVPSLLLAFPAALAQVPASVYDRRSLTLTGKATPKRSGFFNRL